MRDLVIYADGSVRKNGNGGWGYLILEKEEVVVENSSWAYNTTNNRMELEAVINALSNVQIGEKSVTVWSDSQYVIKAFTDGWLAKWKRNKWINNGELVKNQDLWLTLDGIVTFLESAGTKFEWKWCRGHDGNYYNEIVDKLAQKASLDAEKFK